MMPNVATVPASFVNSLVIGEADIVGAADQLASSVTITGTLSTALPSGDAVTLLLPNGTPRQTVAAADGLSFSTILSGTDTLDFGIPGMISAYVVDAAGNQSAIFTQHFTAAAARTVLPVTATPSDFAASGASALALSGDGKSIAFIARQSDGTKVTFGLYIQRLDTGIVTLVTPVVNSDSSASSLSFDGSLIAYSASQNFTNQTFLENLTTGVVTQLSDPAGGSTSGIASTRPSIADDGTVVFESAGDTSLNGYPYQQVFVGRVSSGAASRTLLSAAADGTPGNGDSEYATISADGSTVVFLSTATNLLSAGDPHASSLNGTFQIYALALRDNAVTGQSAGTTVLVSGNPDGTVSDGSDYNPVVSGDGRYVLFESADNSQIYLADLETGTSRIVSTNASGVVANAGAFGASLSADGNTVVFQSTATNLLATGDAATDLTHSQQVYAKNLTTGQVTLLSEGGYIPADAVSQDPTISADGTVAGFASTADNLAPGILGSGNLFPDSRGYVTTLGTPAVPKPVSLFGYRFTYTDGSFYTGTVADDGTYGYTPGQVITTNGGEYVVGAAAGITTEAAGTVTAASYFDVSTSATYTPTAAANGTADGTAGLGSESDSITGPSGLVNFGGGVTEARIATATAYDFAYVYNDGSAYFGTVIGNAASGYKAGETLKNSSGYYIITGSAGASTSAPGTVNTSLYYDASTAAAYVPIAHSAGQSSGVQGLGSEIDTLSTSAGTVEFGLSGADKAVFKLLRTYFYQFAYPDGSLYFGQVVDDGTYDYALNDTIEVTGGTYKITGVSAGAVTLGGQALTPGEVTTADYFDETTKQFYTPINYAAGLVAGYQGLGSEIDYTFGISGSVAFGIYGTLEARQAPNQRYYFSFSYKDGSYYTGYVIDDGSRAYHDGETITTAYGHYSIMLSQPESGGAGGSVAGQVYTQTYFDASSNAIYQPLDDALDKPSGTAGLFSELDSITNADASQVLFGDGGKYEARFTPYSLLNFSFSYKDGSRYVGTVSSDGVSGPKVGQIINTAYGYFDVFSSAGPTAEAPGTVQIVDYIDITNLSSYTPSPISGSGNYGTTGLLTAEGLVSDTLKFGDGGRYEAKHAPNTSWEYEFFYPDGSYYVGDVVDSGKSGFYPGFIEKTPYGYYSIDGGTSASSLPVGSVTISSYYDVTTSKVYTPTGQGAGGIDGTAGLGSEYADTTDNSEQEFGFGGQYEAKQSDVRDYTFTFRYDDASFYQGDFTSSQDIYDPGTIIRVAGGYYSITAVADEHSALAPGTVHVASYFDIHTGKFYTPVRYAEGKTSGTSGLGSELDYISVGGLRSFGGPTHTEANTSASFTLLLSPFQFAFDGPIQGATIGYLNPAAVSNLSIDPSQPTTTTNADGSYQLNPGSGPLVLIGGTDTATGLPFRGVLESAGSGSVLSPVTTLIEAVAVALGDTSVTGVTKAGALVATALALPAGLDLTTYAAGQILTDPTSGADEIPPAEAVYRAGAMLLDVETLIDAAGGSSQSAISSVASALADGSLTDLTDPSRLIEAGVLAPPAETAIKAIVIATNAALDQQLAGVTTPAAIMGLISGASIALQGNAAASLAAADADDAGVATQYVTTLESVLSAADLQAITEKSHAGTLPSAPTITGAVALQASLETTVLTPFAAVVVGDTNAGQTETVTITTNSPLNGALSDPAAAADGSSLSGTVFRVSGSAAQVTADIQRLMFTPTLHEVAPGTAVTTAFSVTVADTVGESAVDNTSSIVVTAVENPPVLGATQAGQAITDLQTVEPFAGATLADPDHGAMETTTVTLSVAGTPTAAAGTLSGAGLTDTGGGTYALQPASAAAEQAMLRALVFTPAAGTSSAGSTVTTSLRLDVSDGTDTVSDSKTSVVTTQATAGAVPVTLRLADDTGISATDAITSDDALAGTAAAGSTVTFTAGTTVLGTALVDSLGAFSFTPTGLPDGAHSVTASDIGTATLSFTLDTTAPKLSQAALTVAGNAAATPIGIAATDNLSAVAQLSATVTALPGDGQVTLNGHAVQTGQMLTGADLAALAFTPTAGVSNVTSELNFTVTDVAGNQAAGVATLNVGALTGGGNGDVHMVTYDGLHYDFQATGDFVVSRPVVDDTDDGFEVQMRATPWDLYPSTSLATEIAARIGQSVIRFSSDGAAVTLNGASVPGLGTASDTVQLADGVLTQTGAASWLLRWNSGETLSVTGHGKYLNFAVTVGAQDSPGSLEGLLGSDRGQANDFQLPNGQVLAQPLSQQTILGQFADGWRVTAANNILDDHVRVTSQTLQAGGQMSFLHPFQTTAANIPGAIWAGSLGEAGQAEVIGQSAIFASGLLANLAKGDAIDVTDLKAATGKASFIPGALLVSDATHSVSIPFAGANSTLALSVTPDPHGGLLIHLA